MKIKRLITSTGFLFFFAGMTVIHAEELPPKFVAADANKDGKLSKDEVDVCVNKRADKKAEELLQKMDVNGDGFLTKDELKGKNLQKMGFADADTNADGKLSKDEVVAFTEKKAAEKAAKRFQLVDADKDGFVTVDEVKQFKQKQKQKQTQGEKETKKTENAEDAGTEEDPLL